MKILFVCTGNTCRSPMAEAVLKNKLHMLAHDDVKVDSCGINCYFDLPISENSKQALKKVLDIDFEHSSRPISQTDLEDSDYIICMTKTHKTILEKYSKKDNLYTFDDIAKCGDITDPYGQDLFTYIKTLDQINKAMDAVLLEITPKL